ncbi:hypothetical protein [Pseudoduganella albidiflava]|uniref:Uncharacterized protein n=1 Tax=Pseudoduganella albidiflava TaxID=321983 RepID=A0A411WZ28_9BURK|nr:hypothetical protein [Pseudoduganella albidiflava]QBI01951.1 hypothetical protein EYF70_14625 [Pseudoduganella albidiflava]GGY38296.1 hypothetical protein GCM10007387_20350 [Pseudoduganella albidiflava]
MAATDDERAPGPAPGDGEKLRLEEFIFVRELYEVFLLLDHISGRWDKDLRAEAGADPAQIIRTICEIGLTPAADPGLRLEQAVALMRAKDMLNTVARPATGLSVAFTILVVGEEDRRKKMNVLRRLLRDVFSRTPKEAPPSPQRGQGGQMWDKPTRVTLARYAYPGLIGVAINFNHRMLWLVLFLLSSLALTCALSWHVAAGNVILGHLDAVRTRTSELRAEISTAELKYTADERARLMAADAKGRLARDPEPVRFCALTGPDGKPRYRTTEEYQFCDRAEALREERRAVRLNLREWLAPWRSFYSIFYRPEPVNTRDPEDASVRRRGTEEMARIVTLVVGTSFLPLAYGMLGAGAAVVRRLWERMRESLLSPRDSTMALLQLALGGTIGACIGLFINPSGAAPGESKGLLDAWALSGSALSFIAGFGVEGVFQALENFVRRLFRTDEPKRGGSGH